MKPIKTYFIPYVLTDTDLPMQYIIIEKKEDMRTRFYKYNKQYSIDNKKLREILSRFKTTAKPTDVCYYGFWGTVNRVITPNGQTAFALYKTLLSESGGWQHTLQKRKVFRGIEVL